MDSFEQCLDEWSGIGGGKNTREYISFMALKRQASEEELLYLTGHHNSIIKLYATWALIDCHYMDLPIIFSKILYDENPVNVQSGCRGIESTLRYEFYFRCFRKCHFEAHNKRIKSYYKKQMELIDSIVFETRNDPFILSSALQKNNANPNRYKIVRRIALQTKNIEAIKALGEYQKVEDIPPIIGLDTLSYEAISVFPHKNFWTTLEQGKRKQSSLPYFMAITAYKDSAAKDLLEEIYESCDSAKAISLFEAISKNFSPVYTELVMKIWQDWRVIDFPTTKKIVQQSSGNNIRLFSSGLIQNKELILMDFVYKNNRKDILPLMLKQVSKADDSLIIEICRNRIKIDDIYNLDAILTLIEKKKLNPLIPELQDKLRSSIHAFDIYYLTVTILSFKDKNANRVLAKTLVDIQEYWCRDSPFLTKMKNVLAKNGMPVTVVQ